MNGRLAYGRSRAKSIISEDMPQTSDKAQEHGTRVSQQISTSKFSIASELRDHRIEAVAIQAIMTTVNVQPPSTRHCATMSRNCQRFTTAT